MLDNRIVTFLTLCETMNYRKTAELLHMTQPTVTQHIHYLESLYHVKLFEYSGKLLTKTEDGRKLEEYSRSVVYNDSVFRSELANPPKQVIQLGATKTIGEYIVDDLILECLKDESMELTLIIDNTKHLLQKLNNFELDFLIVEGYFDKTKYDYKLLCKEELVGICAKNHRFANQEVELRDVFQEHILLREEGSGTRKVFENFLEEQNYTLDAFQRKSVISSFSIIQDAVKQNIAISFVYSAIPQYNKSHAFANDITVMKNKQLATFHIKDNKLFHELNYVYLKNSKAQELVTLFDNRYKELS